MTTSRLNRYAVIEELGEGTFGKVFKARSKEDGRFVAIKVYKDLIGVAQFHNELEILKGVKNMTQYVVQYIDHFDDDIKHYLVLELAESSLFRELRKLEYINGLPESTLQQLVLQLGCALYFLAGKNIVHRDLKPGNILVWKTSSERYLFKLCDFGNSRVAAAEMDSIAGTVPYACPSVVSNCVNGDAGQPRAKYTACEADLWSLSTLIYHCSTGKQAFDVPRNSLHRNVDLDRLLSQRVPRAISGRLVHGKPTYATDLPHPCRYPKLFKEALVQYLAQLLDCKNSNFNFATNKEWATEFGQMRPSLIYHLHQCRVEKFYNISRTKYFAPVRTLNASDVLQCESRRTSFLTRRGTLSCFDPMSSVWNAPLKEELAAVAICCHTNGKVCTLEDAGLNSELNTRSDERVAASVRLNKEMRELFTLPRMLMTFHKDLSDVISSKLQNFESICTNTQKFCSPCVPVASGTELHFSATLADNRLHAVWEQLSRLKECAINNVLVVERTQNKAYLTLSLLDEHMFSATDSNASFYMINELYNRLKSAHLEEEKLDVILSKNVRGKLSNMHKDLSVQIYERGREVICGDDSLRTVILRHNKMCEEYSTYLDMISCVKGIEMLVNDNAESKTTTKLEAAPSIVRLNEISHQSKRLLNKANGLLELIADET